jgi:pimeloyl-ACP methyl ester carboxylesterase
VDKRQVVVGGQGIAFARSAGSGRPVVFVHGNSSSSRTWRAVLDGPFGERYRCLALDLPGHGDSAPASDPAVYSLPGYANVLAGFLRAQEVPDAVVVGWSLGGHIAIEAAPALPDAAGFMVFGTPPVAEAAQLAEAFLPNPAMNVGFTAEVTPEQAREYAASFTAPGSSLDLDGFVADILRTDGAARAGLAASIGAGNTVDEVGIAGSMGRPLGMLQGEGEQLVSLDYLRKLSIPTLWRGAVQIVPGAGHAPHEEVPELFAGLLEEFVADLG